MFCSSSSGTKWQYLVVLVAIAWTKSVAGDDSRSYLGALTGLSHDNGLSIPAADVSKNESIWSDLLSDRPKEGNSYLAAVQRSGPDSWARRRDQLQRNNYNRQQPQRQRGDCQTNYNFDYIQLTLQWGPGFCRTSPQACSKIVSRFTIHGMWLNSRNGEGPSFCCFDNSFNYNSLSNILADLQNYWLSYFNSNNRGFWAHEWLKHGTCARDVPALRGEKNYFGTTLNMVKAMPILETLSKSNIVPSDSKIYIATEINSALKQISQGKDIQIDCDYEHNQSVPVIKGINFCLDRNLSFINCPFTKKKCKSQLYFPSS